ncbi:short-chain dehydrogenase [Xylaria bambusicola]|uniref:short-chain dehydrogenase n=1 Tax=Xylaria bambusicola TaxID=326684 RepID=UPI002007FDB1|nr:short-chain dehydrogenase [Xylaria bambusicola]KAI0520755.1 short-chain dehydrogenase [Xylaria bambusicola]
MCPGEPPLTEHNLGSQEGKVFIVTGASTGLGKELAKILFSKHAKVYIAARSATKAQAAITEIRTLYPASKGDLVYLFLDLSDLSTIKKSAQSFLSRESRLDVLFNNAGVMVPPAGSVTAQGWELQLGTNVLGTFLLTRCLNQILVETVKTGVAEKNSVRVVWVSSAAADGAPKPAIDFDNINYEKREEGQWQKYERSKAGNIIHACEAARQSERSGGGVFHVSLHPGLFPTDLQRTMPGWQASLVKMMGKEPKYGAYTQLYAGLDPNIANGSFVGPYGKLLKARSDLCEKALGQKYWEWAEKQVEPFL